MLDKIGATDLSMLEIERIFKQIDINKNNKIEIDEFMNFMYNPGEDPVVSEAVFKIRKAHKKINAKTLMMMFDAMPTSFKPSFTQV